VFVLVVEAGTAGGVIEKVVGSLVLYSALRSVVDMRCELRWKMCVGKLFFRKNQLEKEILPWLMVQFIVCFIFAACAQIDDIVRKECVSVSKVVM
jgi:hypothetical protein